MSLEMSKWYAFLESLDDRIPVHIEAYGKGNVFRLELDQNTKRYVLRMRLSPKDSRERPRTARPILQSGDHSVKDLKSALVPSCKYTITDTNPNFCSISYHSPYSCRIDIPLTDAGINEVRKIGASGKPAKVQ